MCAVLDRPGPSGAIPVTIPALIDEVAGRLPDAPAVRASTGGSAGCLEPMTYRALVTQSRAVAAGLRELGMRQGDSLVLWLPNGPEWLVLALAVMRLGGLVVPLNTRFSLSDAGAVLEATQAEFVAVPRSLVGKDFLLELRRVIEESAAVRLRATVVVGSSPRREDIDRSATPKLGRIEAYDQLTRFDPLLRDQSLDAESPAHVYVSSGTTGAPKLPLHSHYGAVSRCTAAGRHLGLGTGSVVLAAVPFAGAWGWSLALATLASGACLVPMPVFDPERAIDVIARCAVTHVHASDDMLLSILRHPSYSRARCTAWRSALYGDFTGHAGEEFVAECEAAGLEVITGYGASEMHAFLALWRAGDSRRLRSQAGGWLVEDAVEVRSVEPDSLPVRELPHGSLGELLVRGPSVMLGYLGDPELTSAAFTFDGWYRTGDLGETIAERGVVFHSRLKDTLRLRGFLVDPLEIEAELMSHASVGLAQVVGVQSPAGQVAIAFVQPSSRVENPSPAELVAYCGDRLASYKVPAQVHVVDSFPVVEGPNGTKILKGRLRDIAQDIFGQSSD